jgi:dTMP kinase
MLIVFEGTDGTGKSTAAKWLVEAMKARLPQTMSVEYTNEPTRGLFGRTIREKPHEPVEEAALFMADRVRHVRTLVQPAALKTSRYLVMDRYYYSMVAYQTARQHPDITAKELMEDAEFFCPTPHVLFLFECDVDVAMRRINKRGKVENDFEMPDYQRRVQRIFREIVPPATRIIDTEHRSIESVQNAVVETLCGYSTFLKFLLEEPSENAKKYLT